MNPSPIFKETKAKRRGLLKESNVHQQVVDYIKYQYPKILFRTDFAAGIRMTIGQAVKHKKLQKCRAWPDLFLAHPCNVPYKNAAIGLFIEIKKDKSEVFNKDGTIKSDAHIIEQADILRRLIELGYDARWGCGFDDCKNIIDSYLKQNAA